MSANRCSLQEGSRGVGLRQLLLVLVVIVAITLLALRMYQRSAPPPMGGGTTHPARVVLDNVTLRVEGLKSDMDALQVTEALRRVKGVASVRVDYRAGRAQVAYNPNQTSLEQLIAAGGRVDFSGGVKSLQLRPEIFQALE